MLEAFEAFFSNQPKVLDWAILPIDGGSPYEEEVRRWIAEGKHGSMDFMEQTLELRLKPKDWVGSGESLLLFLYDYPTPLTPFNPESNVPQISSYSQGRDYHQEIKSLLYELQKDLPEELLLKPFADSSPVLERAWVEKAKLGWIGKNTCLLSRKNGSHFFLGGAFLTKKMERLGGSNQEFCGGCTLCIDSCPTQAIEAPNQLNAQKCISYLTIECNGELPIEVWPMLNNQLYGCDICQQVCPWNKKHLGEEKAEWVKPNLEWIQLSRKGGGLKSLIKNTAMMRGGRKKFLRNSAILARQNQEREALDLLREIALEEDGWLESQLNSIIDNW